MTIVQVYHVLVKVSLQNSSKRSSKSHRRNTSGGMPSGPQAFPIFNDDLAFSSSCLVNGPVFIFRGGKTVLASKFLPASSDGLVPSRPQKCFFYQFSILSFSVSPASLPLLADFLWVILLIRVQAWLCFALLCSSCTDHL